MAQPAMAIATETTSRTGPDFVAPGGRTYAAGDRAMALAPNPSARIMTSQQLTITHVDRTNKHWTYAPETDERSP